MLYPFRHTSILFANPLVTQYIHYQLFRQNRFGILIASREQYLWDSLSSLQTRRKHGSKQGYYCALDYCSPSKTACPHASFNGSHRHGSANILLHLLLPFMLFVVTPGAPPHCGHFPRLKYQHHILIFRPQCLIVMTPIRFDQRLNLQWSGVVEILHARSILILS